MPNKHLPLILLVPMLIFSACNSTATDAGSPSITATSIQKIALTRTNTPAITNTPFEKPASTMTPTVTTTPCLGLVATPVSTPLPWSYADDYWNSVAISRIPTRGMECAGPIEIVRKLLLQWFEIIKTNSPNGQCGLEEYTLDQIALQKNTITPQYDIVAGVAYHVKPGRYSDCGWLSVRGQIEANGWIATGDVFGVYRENGFFRLIVLPGWGT